MILILLVSPEMGIQHTLAAELVIAFAVDANLLSFALSSSTTFHGVSNVGLIAW